ncbi:MAG: DUF2961 domain-containing protein [Planctomycetes bacterium]|nr:DUF2961 domain-containing protein [Planctomycetota bacterium]
MLNAAVLLLSLALGQSGGEAAPVTTATLLDEMADLERLGRLPAPSYRTVQFSSFDRRSTNRDAPSWFANADGFGGEPLPAFLGVLRAPDESGIGLYLVAEVDGPGAIVRGWSAGMGGILRVFLDGASEPLYEGDAYAFLARRSEHFGAMSAASAWLGRDPFVQQDADYLPIPFAEGLRVTWEGSLNEVHFYHLQVRCYEKGARVESFAAPGLSEQVRAWLAERAAAEDAAAEGAEVWEIALAPGETAERTAGGGAAGEICWFALNLSGPDRAAALRGTLLTINYDGAEEPQVEAPAGDFFGSGVGLNPLEAVPMTVRRDGTMICRFPMPFQKEARVRLENLSGATVQGRAEIATRPRPFDEQSLYFRARWRVDHELRAQAGAAPCDLPYLVAIGQGRLVGAACMLMNPLPAPDRSGNWWGEGDEKILIDGESAPSTFGTGSEDFYNYSWSRIDLFDHPYCGQPLDSGPGNCGYVSNHRFFILDDIPFERSAALFLELWSHVPVEPLSYGRIAWWYARPGAIDDHRRLQPRELLVPAIPNWGEGVWSEEGEATRRPATELAPQASAGDVGAEESALSRGGPLLSWSGAGAAERLALEVAAPEEGLYALYITALLRHDGPILSARLGGQVLQREGEQVVVLRTPGSPRLLGFGFDPVPLRAGKHHLELEIVVPGQALFETVQLRKTGGPPRIVPGAVEAEGLLVVSASPGLEHERQGMPADRWSGGAHLWVKATKPGDLIELRVSTPATGSYRVKLGLTKSWDYGTIAISLDGRRVIEELDLFNEAERASDLAPQVDLGVFFLGDAALLSLQAVGRNDKSEPPYYYFGVDYVLLMPEEAEEK